MYQAWNHLLFAHWRLEPAALGRVVPRELPLDLYDGSAWLGITPFVVTGFRLRGTPPLPYLSTFPELNVRTYVTVDGKPGIHFLSLDAPRLLAVHGARRLYRLPYHRSRMRAAPDRFFSSRRLNASTPTAEFRANYFGQGAAREAAPGTLEHFLTERYCLYTLDEARRPLRAEIHHGPWPLHDAGAAIAINTMTAPFGVALEGEPVLHFSPRQDTVLWRLERA